MSYDDDAESAPDLVFDRPALIPPLEKGGLWELENDWSLFYKGEIYHIAAGFKTDGASIPRFLWRVCGTPFEVPRVYAAIVHDWLYSGGDIQASRADADALYRDLQIALGVPRFKACIEWVALRLFGGSHWYGNTKTKEGKIMKKMITIVAVAAVAGITGCKSIEVERHGQTLVTWTDTNGVVHAVCDVFGRPVILDGGWEVDYFQHWNWQKFDALHAMAGKDVSLDINNYEGGASASNLTALVSASFDGGAKLATAIGDAYVKIAGGGAQAAMVMDVASKAYSSFTDGGGDPSKAEVKADTATNTVTVSDGNVCTTCTADGTCTTGNCTDK